MDAVRAQYEAFPYPARDPAEEAHRLIQGSPSHPVEIDHFLFGGRRDWRKPFRALVAGGGTGDGLVMLAQKLSDIGCPAEITYLDLSTASRAVAEARVAARGLDVRFLTADLAEAPGLGPFDYIDCCGVLHHLAEPDAGFRALAEALAPDGGIGLMVYAPYGRTGVYALQESFGLLLSGDTPAEKLALAKEVLDGLPESNWLKRNPFVGDHKESDAGLYDLLLHAQDRAYDIGALLAAVDRAGLAAVSVLEPRRYDPTLYLPQSAALHERVRALSKAERMGLAERLAGNMKTHVLYATRAEHAAMAMVGSGPFLAPDLVPHLTVDPGALARQVAKAGGFRLALDGLSHWIGVGVGRQPQDPLASRKCAEMIARIDGRRPLAEIALPTVPESGWAGFDAAMRGFNLLHYSKGARR
ncbi:MAG: class I SAM-dependent methyltransferase [Pseudomonadota bacterium]